SPPIMAIPPRRPRRSCVSASRWPRCTRKRRPAPPWPRSVASFRMPPRACGAASRRNRSVRIADTEAVSASEASALFSELIDTQVLVLAISGGPDSTALMVLAARWRDALVKKPKLIAVTIDHGLRAESKREAADVGRLARKLGIAHRVLRWTGRKPKTGLQEAARAARYQLLAKAAHEEGAAAILTAHTLDDQAETVLIRLTRGSGLTGLGGMQKLSALPYPLAGRGTREGLFLLRP